LTSQGLRGLAAHPGCRLGVWFRRQVPISRFIVDLLAPSRWLVVEVDGSHPGGRATLDALRDRQLGRLGYRAGRLQAELVRRDAQAALEVILAAL
jgi:very-short-patch-repair endonuclease